jgi:hypothetical protein
MDKTRLNRARAQNKATSETVVNPAVSVPVSPMPSGDDVVSTPVPTPAGVPKQSYPSVEVKTLDPLAWSIVQSMPALPKPTPERVRQAKHFKPPVQNKKNQQVAGAVVMVSGAFLMLGAILRGAR